MKELNVPFNSLKKSAAGMYSPAYSDFVMPPVNATKELNRKNEALENRNETLEEKLNSLAKEVADLKELKAEIFKLKAEMSLCNAARK